MSDSPSSFIKNWKHLLIVVLLAVLVPIALLIMVTQFITGHLRGANPGSAAVLARIKPVGEVLIAASAQASTTATAPAAAAGAAAPVAAPVAASPAVPGATVAATAPATSGTSAVAAPATVVATAATSAPADGKKIYDTVCTACHASGLIGAPKFGDKVAWAPRIKTGLPALYNAALHGLNAMPPKGGDTALSDAQVKAAVDYMVSAAK